MMINPTLLLMTGLILGTGLESLAQARRPTTGGRPTTSPAVDRGAASTAPVTPRPPMPVTLDTTALSPKPDPGPLNRLSFDEARAGWFLLFNGRDSQGWRGAYETTFPKGGWVVRDGLLIHEKATGAESTDGGDIVTEREYTDFILSLEFKISPGGNSGIKYYVTESPPRRKGSAIGLEYQILDDDRHPDAKMGRDGNRTCASLYDLITASPDMPLNPPGEWNHAVIRSRGTVVEHFLNGRRVVMYDRASPEFARLVAQSKYHEMEGFGRWPKGRILLQDHGDEVAFRSIKIMPLQ